MARKFIISEDRFIMGNVTLHMDLIPHKRTQDRMSGFQINSNPRDHSFRVLGGGRWDTDKENKILYLWGASVDYGYAEPAQIKRAIESPETFISSSMEGWDVLHSPIISDQIPELETFTKLTVVP